MIYLVITPFFPTPDSFRGPYVYDQVKAILKSERYDRVVVIRPTPFYSKEHDYTYEGVNVYRFKTYEIPSAAYPGVLDRLNIRSFFKLLDKLNIKTDDIAVVHSHVTGLGIYANALKKLNTNIKTVLQHHGFDVLSLTNGKLAKYKWHEKVVESYGIGICNNIDLHVAVSKKTLSHLRAYSINIKDSYVLYNGVDTTKFFYDAGAKSNSNIFKIGCVGNFWQLKDQITLIKAVEILVKNGDTDIFVEFIGSGYTIHESIDYVNTHNLQDYFKFTSEITHKELNSFYNSLDLFVLPSYYEAFGCVYTEAYACGVPFIAVKGQGISEILTEKEADKWLISKGDFVSLAAKIAQYKAKRYKQELNTPVDIKTRVNGFLDYIDKYNSNI